MRIAQIRLFIKPQNEDTNMSLSVDVFTNQYLLELEPKETEYIVSETACKGFSVRVFPSGIKTFIYRSRTNNRSKKLAIARVNDISINDARFKALELGAVLQVKNISDILYVDAKETVIYQLNKLYQSYDWSLLGTKSKVGYSRHLDKLATTPKFKNIESLSKRSSIKSYLDEIARDKPVTANRTKAAISKLINFLVDDDLLPYNVSHRMKKYPEKSRKRSLDAPLELKAFLNQLNNSKQITQLTKDSIKLYLLTGCRKNELRLMQNNELSLPCSTFTLSEERSKTSERIVPLVDSAMAILNKYSNNKTFSLIKENGYVLANDTVNQAIVRLTSQLGLAKATTHDLRRTVGTIMARQRVSLEVRKRVLGHHFSEMSTLFGEDQSNSYYVREEWFMLLDRI
jgi:integrase